MLLSVHSLSLGLSTRLKTLTVYHVNPLHEGVIPVDMDSADLRGDMFFDLRSKTAPIECSSRFINGK